MEWEEKLVPFLKEHGLALVLGVAGLLCLGYGLVNLSQPQSVDPVSTFQQNQGASPVVRTVISPIPKQIAIDIEGAVQKPGVYKLPSDSRIQDALIASGGLSQNADRQRVAQSLNLAAPLTDGAKLYVPAVGEQYTGSGGALDGSFGTGVQGSSLVNINQASEAELDALPGVGAVTAQKIIDNRPYQNVQQLLDKKAVGASEFAKIKDKVSVY